MKKLKNKIKHFFYVVNRHIFKTVLRGDFGKPAHFIWTGMKHKMFGTPYLAMIETCNFCNLRCPTCTTPRGKITRPREVLSLENCVKIIDNIKKEISVLLPWFSNEPLLNPDLVKIIKYAGKNNIYTVVSTNAALLTEKKGRELVEAGMDEILLCFDGVSRESYEPFRKGADFETVLKNIKNFCALRSEYGKKMPFVELQFILTKLNQDEVGEIKKLAKELCVDRLRVKSFALSEYAYSKEEIKNLGEEFLPDKKEFEDKIRYRKEGENEMVLKNKNPACRLVSSNIVILVDGRATICCYDLNGDYAYQGNLLRESLRKIWNAAENRQKRKMAEKRKFPLCKVCAN